MQNRRITDDIKMNRRLEMKELFELLQDDEEITFRKNYFDEDKFDIMLTKHIFRNKLTITKELLDDDEDNKQLFTHIKQGFHSLRKSSENFLSSNTPNT